MVMEQEEIRIKPFGKLKISDPEYDIAIPDEEKLTLNEENIPSKSTRKAGIYLEKVNEQENFMGNKLDFSYFHVLIYNIGKGNESTLEAHKKGGYFPEELRKKDGFIELGTDSASFAIQTEYGGTDIIHTGADGIYGIAFHYAHNRAVIVDLTISADMISQERLKETLLQAFETAKVRLKHTKEQETS